MEGLTGVVESGILSRNSISRDGFSASLVGGGVSEGYWALRIIFFTGGKAMGVDIRRALKKFLPHLIKAREDNLNEADTVQRVIKVFEEVLGYDPMTEITQETKIKDKYADIGVKVDGVIRLLVECKAAGVTLRDRHIEQGERYAAEGNINWALLTNGVEWNLYHLTFDEGIEYERVFATDLTKDDFDKAAELLELLHRQSFKSGKHEEYWRSRVALSPESIGRAMFTDDVLRLIRREIRKRDGILIDEEDLAAAIHEMFSAEARERTGPVKVRRRQKAKPEKAGMDKVVSTEVAAIPVSIPAATVQVPEAAKPASQG
jgi:predicted type IV restriction endonuclease